ncbi:MAG: hypothetical protein ACI4LX_06600 [Treponema sp.]
MKKTVSAILMLLIGTVQILIAQTVPVNKTSKEITYKTVITPENHDYNVMQIVKWVNQTLKEYTYDVGSKSAFLGKSRGDAENSEYRPTITYKDDNYIAGYSNIGKGLSPYFFDFEIEITPDELIITYNNFLTGTKKIKTDGKYFLDVLSAITEELFAKLK